MSHTAPNVRHGGVLISASDESDKLTEIRTIQCCHCGALWLHKPGSGKLRGICLQCSTATKVAMFCGPQCETCVPQELLIENLEKGMPYDQARRHRPIRIQVCGEVPR